MKEIDESKFNMWRALVALVHADGLKHPEEDKFISEYIDRLNFSHEQKQILRLDLNQAQPVMPFYHKITNPSDRSHFIYFARILFWSDGVFDEQEKRIFESMQADAQEKVDLKEVMSSVNSIVDEFAAKELNKGFREKLADFVMRYF